MRFVILSAMLALASPAFGAEPALLDDWAGTWLIEDPSGKRVGESKIVVQAPDAMIYEERRIGGEDAQPLWFANSERDGAWIQLFVGASGKIRAFRQTSLPGAWPMVMTGDVVLRDGRSAAFRLTVSRQSGDLMRRLLERSTDQGASWSPVFDYVYRRKT